VQVSNGETASAATTISPPPGGSVAVKKTGPKTVTIPLDAAPERITYTVQLAYVGPPLTGRVQTRFTDQLPSLVKNPGFANFGTDGDIARCLFPPANTPGGAVSCDVGFSPTRLSARIAMTVRPTGETGAGTNTITLDTGDSASWDTGFRPAPPPPPPPPVSGRPAAPAQTVTETFTDAGQAKPEAVAIAPTAETAQVVATWTQRGVSLDVTSFQLVQDGKVVAQGRTLAAVQRRKPARLKVRKKRKPGSIEARVTNLKRGKLRFKVVAQKINKATKVRVVVRQSRKRVAR